MVPRSSLRYAEFERSRSCSPAIGNRQQPVGGSRKPAGESQQVEDGCQQATASRRERTDKLTRESRKPAGDRHQHHPLRPPRPPAAAAPAAAATAAAATPRPPSDHKQQPTPGCRLPTADCRLPTVHVKPGARESAAGAERAVAGRDVETRLGRGPLAARKPRALARRRSAPWAPGWQPAARCRRPPAPGSGCHHCPEGERLGAGHR